MEGSSSAGGRLAALSGENANAAPAAGGRDRRAQMRGRRHSHYPRRSAEACTHLLGVAADPSGLNGGTFRHFSAGGAPPSRFTRERSRVRKPMRPLHESPKRGRFVQQPGAGSLKGGRRAVRETEEGPVWGPPPCPCVFFRSSGAVGCLFRS